VVITADHGEMLGDHQDLVGHMLSLHDNLLHVPLIIRHPAYSKGLVVERVVQNLDLYSSILEWTGCPTDAIPAAQLQRPGLSNAMQDPNASEGVAFAEEDYTDSYDPRGGLRRANPKMEPAKFPRHQLCVHSSTHKYIWSDDRPGELYDLRSDPDENINLIDVHTPAEQTVLKDLRQKLNTWRAELRTFPPNLVNDAPQVDAVTMDRLRSLGYVE
jgi:arylsulfatase A-like enzyme